MNLYEINRAIEDFIASNVDYETGEMLNVEGLEELNVLKEEKHESIALVIKSLNAEAEAFKNEVKTLQARQKSVEVNANRLREYLSSSLQGEKLKTARVDINYRKSESVEIFDIDALGEEFIKTKIEADKTAIKKAIKSGVEVAGATLVKKNNITIK